MKGIVLAGGTGSRLRPLTASTNKHVLPVGDKPMIFWPLLKLKEAGIEDVMVVTGREHMGDVIRLLGSGRELGLDLTYRVQDEAGGIAEALGLCEGFAGGGTVVVLLGDNIFKDSIAGPLNRWHVAGKGCLLFLKAVPDTWRFGVARFSGGRPPGQIMEIIEKPQPEQIPSRYAVTGIYAYDSSVWHFIRTLKPSARGELEITDVNNHYLKHNNADYALLDGWWSDAGTFKSLQRANLLASTGDGRVIVESCSEMDCPYVDGHSGDCG